MMFRLVVTLGVDYHRRVGTEAVLSLQYANPEPHPVIEKEQSRSEQAGTEVLTFESSIVPYRLEKRIYVLYTAKVHPRQFPDKDLLNLTEEDKLIVFTVLDGFETIEKECNEAGSPLLWYKKPDLSQIIRQVDRVQWRQPVATVGGNLLSNLITGHGLPNANHRTSLSFLETYLQTFDSTFEIPDTGVSGEWYDWSADFVQESKRLLMMSRKAPMFRYLVQWGCEHIERKNGDSIYLQDYNIDVDDPYSHFRSKHKKLCTDFVRRVLDRTENQYLIDKEDPGKTVFLDRLASDQ